MRFIRPFLPRSLQTQFLIALLIIGVLPISLAGATVLAFSQRNAAEQSVRELSGLARGLVGEIDIYIDSRLEEAGAMTTLPGIIAMDATSESRQLQALFFEYTHFIRLAVFDTLGTLVASSHQDEPKTTLADAVFANAVHGQQSWRTVSDPAVGHLYLLIDSPHPQHHAECGRHTTHDRRSGRSCFCDKPHTSGYRGAGIPDRRGGPRIDPSRSKGHAKHRAVYVAWSTSL